VSWEDTAAVLIGAEEVPAALIQLEWNWKALGDTLKLLGYHFEAGSLHDMVLNELKSKQANQIKFSKPMALPYMEWLTILKSPFMGKIWYVLALWKGEENKFNKIESKIVKFLWAGIKFKAHPRVKM
jgi:hypothetical protein